MIEVLKQGCFLLCELIVGGAFMPILEVKNLKKIYKTRFGGNQVEALSNISFTVEQGEYVAIMGESGSGKTTLLNMMASLDRPTEGSVLLNGKSYADIREDELSSFRRDHLGFVFQDFNLLDNFNIKDNILLPLVLSDRSRKEMKEKLLPLVRKLGIEKLLEKYPYEVSGGQKQRTAVARALITSPTLILADEPTGALDSRSSEELLKLFDDINREGQTIMMVTHSVQAAGCANRVLFIKDGKIICEVSKRFPDEDIKPQLFSVLSMISAGGKNNE
jgi:putative ABC transport system ATP-binding protein